MEDKLKISIIDKNFEGRDIINMPGVNFSWWNKNELISNSVFITDYCLEFVDRLRDHPVKKIAWLLEPRAICSESYAYIKDNYNKFDAILTFDKEILDTITNSKFMPYGSYWAEKTNIPKILKISMISSSKNFAKGHQLRHDIHNAYKGRVDMFGSITGKRIDSKNIGLDNYMFSIAVENSIQDGYWTEKILDCFATKTIPIYWGSKTVCDFFNKDGIMFFNSLDELDEIIKACTEETYQSMLSAVEDNFERVSRFRIPEMFLEDNYNYLLA